MNGDEYTTDPYHSVDRVTYLTTEPHKAALASFKNTVAALRGPCAWREFTVHLSDTVRQALPPNHAFRDKGHLVSDVAVLSEAFMPSALLPRTYRLEVEPPLLLVLEILSESTGRSDLGPKLDTYATMGIAEYWLYDLKGQAPPATNEDGPLLLAFPGHVCRSRRAREVAGRSALSVLNMGLIPRN